MSDKKSKEKSVLLFLFVFKDLLFILLLISFLAYGDKYLTFRFTDKELDKRFLKVEEMLKHHEEVMVLMITSGITGAHQPQQKRIFPPTKTKKNEDTISLEDPGFEINKSTKKN